MKRPLARLATAALLLLAFVASPVRAQPSPSGCARSSVWPHWSRYVETFLSAAGRVIEHSAADRTTSEGQAYALFFALVANDRDLFARLLSWTERNLAEGELFAELPAWSWGKRGDASWGVLDDNSASDADLWLGYALLEAGRLWSEPRYDALARALLANVVRDEVAVLPGLGPTLLPGPDGFELEGGRAFRLNPSYPPALLLRRFARAHVPGPWEALLESSASVLRGAAGSGAVADWVLYRPRRGFFPDPVHGRTGSYDAIRSYLWLGLLPEGDPAQRALPGAAALLGRIGESGQLFERLEARSLRGSGEAPPGFAGALLPLARARHDERAERVLEARIAAAAHGDLFGDPPTYYDQNLLLFGRGFVEGRYRFARDGSLVPAWEAGCGRTAR